MDYNTDRNRTPIVRQETAYNYEGYEGDYPVGPKTVSDLEATPEDMRVELINGEFYNMAEPLVIHQDIVGEIFVQLHNYIKKNGGKC